MIKQFLVCILQHRNVSFSVTAFFHLHAALRGRPDLQKKVKIVFSCTGRELIALKNIKKSYSDLYDIDVFECEGEYSKKIDAVVSSYPASQYEYFIKHDEDVFVSPPSWITLLDGAALVLTDPKNLLLSVNLSTGIPSWSRFLRLFFTPKEQNLVAAKLALSALPDECWGNNYECLNQQIAARDAWDENAYWEWVNSLGYDYRGIHPVRLDIWYPNFINQKIIDHYQSFLEQSVGGEVIKVDDRYFCNSFFCMRYQRYQDIWNNKSLFVDPFDEVPINRYAVFNHLNICFIENSLAIHIIYNSVYGQNVLISDQFCSGKKLEQYFLRQYFNGICEYLDIDAHLFDVGQNSIWRKLRLRFKKAVAQFSLNRYQRYYWP